MMEVEFIQQIVGKGFAFSVGERVTLANDVAEDYIAAGYAVPVAKPAVKRAERATKNKGEKR
jgi:hypothetical protein